MPVYNTIGCQTSFLSPPSPANDYGSLAFIGNAGFTMEASTNTLLQGIGTGDWTYEGYYYFNRTLLNRYYHAIGNQTAATVNASIRTTSIDTEWRANINGSGLTYSPVANTRRCWVHLLPHVWEGHFDIFRMVRQ